MRNSGAVKQMNFIIFIIGMFHKEHLLTLGKYIAIWFLSGSISHWFFSWQKSVIMALLWLIIFFICESMSESKERNWKELVLFVLVFPISIGMVSWGLQHFLDSPMRSLWIIPLWYFLSLALFQWKSPDPKRSTRTVLWFGALIAALLWGIVWALITLLPSSVYQTFGDDHHGNDQQWAQLLPTKEDHIAMGHVMPEDGAAMDHGEMVVDELSFIQLMIPHHQEAVDTTTELLKTTVDFDLQTLWNAIIEAQKQEIAMMQSWLQQRYPNPWIDHWISYHLMMRPTIGITDSNEIDAIRTTDMIVHHEWAVQMAEKILTLPDVRPEVQAFARDVIRAQSTEIETMRSWLGNKEVVMPHVMDMNDHNH
jgi:uncharacterized protein (DUF305 family)